MNIKTPTSRRLVLALVCAVALCLMLVPALLPETRLVGVDWTASGWSIFLVPMLWALIVAGLAAVVACALGVEPDHHGARRDITETHSYQHVRHYRDRNVTMHLSREEIERIRRQMARSRHIEC